MSFIFSIGFQLLSEDNITENCPLSTHSHCMYKAAMNLGQTNYTETVCNCLPACTSIQYDALLSQTPFDWKKKFEWLGFMPYQNKYVMVLLIIIKNPEINDE